MLSEAITDKRADVAVRFMDRLMVMLDKADKIDEPTAQIAEVLAKFIASTFESEDHRNMAESTEKLMKKLEKAMDNGGGGFDLRNLEG